MRASEAQRAGTPCVHSAKGLVLMKAAGRLGAGNRSRTVRVDQAPSYQLLVTAAMR